MSKFTKFYSSKKWQDCRNSYIKAHSLCEDCLAKGFITPAEIVHHVIEIDDTNINNPLITLSHDNLRAVCRECHAEEHGFVKRRWKISADGRVAPLKN